MPAALNLINCSCEINDRIFIVALLFLRTLIVFEFPVKDHLAVSGSLSNADAFDLVEKARFKLAISIITHCLNQLHLWDLAERMAVPSITLQSFLHVILKTSSLNSFPEVSQGISRSLGQLLSSLNLHPEGSALRLGLVLKSNFKYFDGLSDSVLYVLLCAERNFLRLFMRVVERKVLRWVEKLSSFY